MNTDSRPLAADGNLAVTGVQFGDEGKGQIVDCLSDRFGAVVRYNGGANAGHSVWIGGEKHALHLIPCGILRDHTVNVIGNGVVIDPVQLINEMEDVIGAGVNCGPANMKVSDRAHVVMPYHKTEDGLMEKAMSADGEALGTTKRGIGPCYADKAMRSTAIRMADLLNPDALAAKLPRIVAVKNAKLRALSDLAGEDFQTINVERTIEEAAAEGNRLAPFVCDTQDLLAGFMAEGKRLLFEGANAVLLDVDFGTYPYVTSSCTSALGIYSGAGVPGGSLSDVVGVAKMYMSRVGAGPFPTEIFGDEADRIRTTGGEFGTTTGRPRRIGWLDLVMLRHTARLNGSTALAVTGLSMLTGMESLKVCTHYEYNGTRLDRLPADITVLAEVKPVYETMDGFPESIVDCATREELPKPVQRYIELVEAHVGVPIRAICVGKGREQVIMN